MTTVLALIAIALSVVALVVAAYAYVGVVRIARHLATLPQRTQPWHGTVPRGGSRRQTPG